MIRRLAFAPFALVALLTLPACDSGGTDAVGVTGTWEGTVASDAESAAFPISLRLRDNGVSVIGSGVVEGLPEGSLVFGVDQGSFASGRLRLALRLDRTPFAGGLDGVLVNEDPGQIEGSIQAGEVQGSVAIELRSRDV